MQNHTRQRYISTSRIRDKWGNFDAQPLAIREALANHALNVWPGDTRPLTSATMADLEKRHLAGLESVWGPDHPAVIDAKRKVRRTRNGLQRVLTASDLF